MSKKEEDLRFFVTLIKSKVAELANLCANVEHIIALDDAAQAPEPVADTEARKKRIERCKEKVRAYVLKVNERENGINFQCMKETWLTRNNQTGGLDVVTHDSDLRLTMGSFERKTDRYSDDDPDVKVRQELYLKVLAIFDWLLKEKKQHRIDVVYPYRGQCSVAVE